MGTHPIGSTVASSPARVAIPSQTLDDVILSTWLFRASSIMDPLWYGSTGSTKLFTLRACPCTFISGLLVPSLAVCFFSGPCQLATPVATAQVYSNLGPLSTQMDGKVYRLKLCPSGGFPLITIFQGHPFVGCSIATVYFHFVPGTGLTYPRVKFRHFFLPSTGHTGSLATGVN